MAIFIAKGFAQFPHANFSVMYGYLYGSSAYFSDADDDFGGWVTDGNGMAYIIHANKTINEDQSNIVVTKFNLENGTIVWAKNYGSDSRGEHLIEPGGNGITEGGASTRNIAIDADGNIYITCSIKDGFYRIYTAKLNPNDGSILWEKSWKNADNDYASSEAISYSIDVQAGKVFVAGTSNNMEIVLIYNASDGSLQGVTKLDIYSGSGDKAYAVRATPDGNTIYIGGWTAANSSAFLAKFTNGGSNLAWFDLIGIPYASRITDIDLDSEGNVYLNSDIHGTDTYFEIIKVDTAGNFIWERNFGVGNSNDRYNGTNVDVIGNYVYVSGRAGMNDDYTHVDQQYGDGMFLKYDLDGNLISRYYYFTGTNTEEMAADWVKGIIEYNGSIYLGGSIYPYTANYTGAWFIAPDHSGSATITLTKHTDPDNFITDELGYDAGLTMGTVADFNGYVFEDITDANATTYGNTQVYLWKVTPNPEELQTSADVNIRMFPNPVANTLYISTDETKNTEIQVIDVSGKTVISKSFDNPNLMSVDVSVLTQGIYYVKISSENFVTTQKILVQK